jgi:hypothetical protein
MRRILALAGIDPAQWWALTRTYLLMDWRRSSGGAPHAGQTAAVAALLVTSVLNSIVIAVLAFIVRDPFSAALLMVTMIGLTVSMLLLVDFAGSVMSAEDYWVIAPRPVGSRTYFAARLAAVLAYVLTIAGIMSAAPAVVFAWRHGLGAGGAAGALLAALLSAAAGSALIIGIYTHLLARLDSARLVRVMSGIHLLASGVSLSGFFLVMRGFEDARIANVSIGDMDWIWYVPLAWFAALVPALGGIGEGATLAAAGLSFGVTLGLLWLASGNVSLEFAGTLSEAKAALPGRRGRRIERLPGFREGEPYVVATLVRAQFRHDLRFRLGVLAVIPMMLFYLAIGWDEGALADPFASGRPTGAALIYLPLGFLPMILHGALLYSEHWRAAWIFRAAPADPARLVIAMKNFVAVFFIGGYALALGAVWAFAYEKVWHAAVHAAVVAAGAHMLLQTVAAFTPAVPFSKEPARAAQSGRLTGLFFVAMLGSALVPLLLPVVYARPPAFGALLAVIAVSTYALERRLHRRAGAYAGEVELV